jgi:hypothetical protein
MAQHHRFSVPQNVLRDDILDESRREFAFEDDFLV